MTLRGRWKAFSADVAIHTMVYLGALLLILVLLGFFGLGFYGDLVAGEHWAPWRPLVAAGIPALLFAMAWFLRSRTGVPFTANAIGFVAALTAAVMLATLFQDGAPWGPPDLDGPARWFGYAGVGVMCAVLYGLAARRAAMYGYLVAPAVYLTAGSLGLFLEDGLSLIGGRGISSLDQFTSDGIAWEQMLAVLLGMAATVAALRLLHRRGPLARAVVRTTLVTLPVIALVALGFAATPAISGDADVSAAPTAVLAASGVVAFLLRGSAFAWEGFGAGLRRWLGTALLVVAIGGIGVAWLGTAALGVTAGWLGLGFAIYAAGVLLLSGRLGLRSGPVVLLFRGGGAIGLVVSIVEPVAAIIGFALGALALAAADTWEGFRRVFGVVAPYPASAVVRTLMVVGMVAVAVGESAFLAPPAVRPAVVLAGGLLVAVARFLPARASGVRQASGLAVLFAVAAVIMALARQLDLGVVDRPTVGRHLLAAGLVILVARLDWLLRLPLVVAAMVPGSALVLRVLDVAGATIDAATVAVAGAALLVLALLRTDRLGREADLLGHLLVWSGPFVGAPSSLGLLIGLAGVSLTHLGVAAAVDRGRGSFAAVLPVTVAAVAHLVIGALTLPVVAVASAREFEWFANSRPRAGYLVAGVAWGYAALTSYLRAGYARRTLAFLGGAMAILAVLVAAPDAIVLMATSWSGAAVLAWEARRAGSPLRATFAWAMGLLAAMLTAAYFGVGRTDLHEPLFAGGVVLVAIGAFLTRAGSFPPEGGRRSLWGLPPLGLGLLAIPAALSFVIADRGQLVLFALAAAGAYVGLAWVLHTGAFTPLVVAMGAVAYGDALPTHPLVEPLLWLPFAAAVFAVAALQPRRPSGHWLGPVLPGLTVSWVAVCALGAAVAAGSSEFPAVVAGSAVLVGAAAIRWRSIAVAYLGLGLVAWAGFTAGDGWWAVALGFDAVAVGIDATRRADGVARVVLAPGAAGLFAAGLAALGAWQQWGVDTVVLAAGAGGGASGVTAITLSVARLGPRWKLWELPAHLFAHGAIVLFVVVGATADGDRGWVWAAGLGFEALVSGLIGTMRAGRGLTLLSAAFAATGSAALGGWLDLAVEVWLTATLLCGVLVGVVAIAVTLGSPGPRLGVWEQPFHLLAQAALLGHLGIAFFEFSEIALVSRSMTAVAAVEAVGLAVVATVQRALDWTPGAAVLATMAIGAGGFWADLGPRGIVSYAGTAAGASAALALVALWRPPASRWFMWWPALAAMTQVGLVATAIAAFDRSGATSPAFAVSAMLLGGEGVLSAAVGWRVARWRTPGLMGGGGFLAAAAVAAMCSVSGQSLATAVAIGLSVVGAALMGLSSGPGDEWWRPPGLSAAWGFTALVPLAQWWRFDSPGSLAAVLAIGGAGVVVGSVASGRWRTSYVGMGEWLLAALVIAGPDFLTGDPNLVVVPVAGTVLAVLTLERARARYLDEETSPDLHQVMSAVEVIAMGAPLLTSGWFAYNEQSLAHLGLLATEAVGITAWSLFTRVRRRLAVGGLGLLAVVLYPAVRVFSGLVTGEASGGTWLAIGAGLAVLLITVGSILERNRVRLGELIKRLIDLLEDWE